MPNIAVKGHLLWPPYLIGQAIIFLPFGFFLLLSVFFFFLVSQVIVWTQTELTDFSTPTTVETRMWANDQRDGRPAEYRWCPLFNAAKFG